MIILPNTNTEGAIIAAERIRTSVEKQIFDLGEKSIKKTISIGIKTKQIDEKITAEEMQKQADALLYKAKESGRNRVFAEDYETPQKQTLDIQPQDPFDKIFQKNKQLKQPKNSNISPFNEINPHSSPS